MDANFIQKRMQELQQNEDVANAFGRLVSGKSNYKAVIEKKTCNPEVQNLFNNSRRMRKILSQMRDKGWESREIILLLIFP